MPPKFLSSNFLSEEGEQLPDHIEAQPAIEERDPTKYWLVSRNMLPSTDVETEVLAVDIDDLPTARALRAARLHFLQQSSVEDAEKVIICSPKKSTIAKSRHQADLTDVLSDLGGNSLQTFLTTSEVARLFQVSERAVTDWAKRGRLPFTRTPGGRYRYPLEVVNHLLEESRKPEGSSSTSADAETE